MILRTKVEEEHMAILRVRHPVKDYAMWKRSFDADPLDRRGSGVLRYRIAREVGNDLDLTIELEFADIAKAESMAERLRRLWQRPEVAGMLTGPVAEVLNVVEEAVLD